MSLKALSWAFEQCQISKTAKLVLLSLANCVNAAHQNKSYPSYDYLQKVCCKASRATIARALDELEAQNLIHREYRGVLQTGKQSTCYHLNLSKSSEIELMEETLNSSATEKFSGETIEKFSFDTRKVSKLNSNQEIEPVNKDNQEIRESSDTTTTSGKNHQAKPAENRKRASAPPSPKFDPKSFEQDIVTTELWSDFVDMRQAAKKPLTQTATTRLVNSLAKLKTDGYDPEYCLEQSVINGWTGVFPKPKPTPLNGKNGTHRPQTRSEIIASVSNEIHRNIQLGLESPELDDIPF